MSRASTPTLLSLQRYAKIIGVPPVFFAGAFAETVWTMKGACEEVWPQFAWQKNMECSREDLAEAIADAEEDIALQLGFWPAPKWISAEERIWPRPGYQINNIVRTRFGKLITPGRRAVSEIDSDVTVVYSDEDSDNWDETATITVTTSITNKNEIKVYFAGHGGEPEWEIRPVKSITISGGTATIVVDSWMFIKPELLGAFPTSADFAGVNIESTDNYVDEVDVYREYTDTTVSVEHYWLPGSGCTEPSCTRTSSENCFVIVDPDAGYIRPLFDTEDFCTHGYSPSGYRVWYLGGDQSDRYVNGSSLDPLSDYWAQAIAWLATARLERTPCSCGTGQAYFDAYTRDLARIKKGGDRNIVTQDLLNNSLFGTKMGEVKAWERVSKAHTQLMRGSVI